MVEAIIGAAIVWLLCVGIAIVGILLEDKFKK